MAPNTRQQQPEANPTEYAPVERVTGIEERLGKTYSSERYEDFQDAVEKVTGRFLETTPAHDKLRTWLQTEIKLYMDDRGWKNKTFWIPTVLAAVAAIAAVIALFKP